MEYGGFLPLELNKGCDYFEKYGNDVSRLNTGRNAIVCALIDACAKKVFLPKYNCEYVRETISKYGISIELYSLNDKFEPVITNFSENDWILYTNYFGVLNIHNINSIIKKYRNVIIDNTQDFYFKPILKHNVYNVYSCRKFFGVANGAYLIHKGGIKADYESSQSTIIDSYLLASYEQGTNEVYQDYLNSEKELSKKKIEKMSKLTMGIMNSINYQNNAKIRKRNYSILDHYLKRYNALKFDVREKVPMIYPFYFENDSMRDYLISNKIYVPQWWKYLLNEVESDSIEARLSKWLFALPIDQRYGTIDMENISKIVINGIELLGKNK